MRLKGYTADTARLDEDGGLVCSTEFMHAITNVLKMTVESTGGYNSTNNGMVESPIKPVKRIKVFVLEAFIEHKSQWSAQC